MKILRLIYCGVYHLTNDASNRHDSIEGTTWVVNILGLLYYLSIILIGIIIFEFFYHKIEMTTGLELVLVAPYAVSFRNESWLGIKLTQSCINLSGMPKVIVKLYAISWTIIGIILFSTVFITYVFRQ